MSNKFLYGVFDRNTYLVESVDETYGYISPDGRELYLLDKDTVKTMTLDEIIEIEGLDSFKDYCYDYCEDYDLDKDEFYETLSEDDKAEYIMKLYEGDEFCFVDNFGSDEEAQKQLEEELAKIDKVERIFADENLIDSEFHYYENSWTLVVDKETVDRIEEE